MAHSRFYGRQEFVCISHPDVESCGWAPVASLGLWQSIGWDLADVEDEPELTEQGVSDQEGDEMPDADEESMS